MRRQQIILLSAAAVLFILIFFVANKKPPKAEATLPAVSQNAAPTSVNMIELGKENAAPALKATLTQLEKQSVEGNQTSKINALHELAHLWKDSLRNQPVAVYYEGEIAKLENSEKSLNFAANSLLQYLMVEHDPGKQKWYAEKAKELFDKSLEINPANDSTVVGLGATYMFGNISDNPMEGITKVRQVADKNPANTYAQMMLGLGGMKSGQFENAVKRFEKVIENEPDNLLAIFSIAESYERLSDKENAIKWYNVAKDKVQIEEAKKDIDERIRDLQLR